MQFVILNIQYDVYGFSVSNNLLLLSRDPAMIEITTTQLGGSALGCLRVAIKKKIIRFTKCLQGSTNHTEFSLGHKTTTFTHPKTKTKQQKTTHVVFCRPSHTTLFFRSPIRPDLDPNLVKRSELGTSMKTNNICFPKCQETLSK